jgi:hypothetical protein
MTSTSLPILVSNRLNKNLNVHDHQEHVEIFYQKLFFAHVNTHFGTILDNQSDNNSLTPFIYMNTICFLMVSVLF